MCNMLVRGISQQVKMEIEEAAHIRDLSVNQLLVHYISEGIKRERKEKEALKSHMKAMRDLKKMREELYKKHGVSNDAVQIIREMRDSRYGK